MSYNFLFPNGRNKALTFSYDDGQVADKRLVSIFDKYNLKATFHLNTGTLDGENFIKKNEIKELYKNHEIACHSLNHKYMNNLTAESVIREILHDRMTLEKFSDRIVVGFSYPFGEYSDELITRLKALGIKYARTVESTNNFSIPSDFMKWNPTCHHSKVTDNLIEDFCNPPSFRKLSLLYIWGHSFEFDRENSWDKFDEICNKLHGRDDVWYTTNIEFRNYILAARSLVSNVSGTRIYNPSGFTLWLDVNGSIVKIMPGGSLSLG